MTYTRYILVLCFLALTTLSAIKRLKHDPNVLFIELSRLASPQLDRSVPDIGADVLHRATPPITGAGRARSGATKR